MAWVAAGSLLPCSALRREARADTSAVRCTLTSASGHTTDPMSRPSTTMPPSPMVWRCCATRRVRTWATDATSDTAAVTASPRMGSATSMPSMVTVGSSGSVPETRRGSWARAATAAWSVTSTPWPSIHQVMARYCAPVSR